MKILVVDDSSTMRRIISNTLKKIGYSDLVEAGDGKEGLARMAENTFDLIVTDWNMPNMDGLEFTKVVRSTQGTVPILMVTTNAAKTDVIEALKAGVNTYVVKPMTPETLEEKIKAIFK